MYSLNSIDDKTKKIKGQYYGPNYTYTGDFDSEGKFSGEGQLEFNNSSTITGTFHSNDLHGDSITAKINLDHIIKGNYYYGQRNGRFTYEVKNSKSQELICKFICENGKIIDDLTDFGKRI